jgi:hypothetical protein
MEKSPCFAWDSILGRRLAAFGIMQAFASIPTAIAVAVAVADIVTVESKMAAKKANSKASNRILPTTNRAPKVVVAEM